VWENHYEANLLDLEYSIFLMEWWKKTGHKHCSWSWRIIVERKTVLGSQSCSVWPRSEREEILHGDVPPPCNCWV